METTTNYNLSKPGASDYVDISVLNANMDTVDTQLKNAQSHRESSGLHVTEAQKTKWDGYETVHTLTHAKTGTVHALTGLNGAAGLLSCQFKATAAFAAGNTLKVDGTSYTIKLTNGEDAEDNLFVSGAIVSCIVDTSGKTVNFKAGGGLGTSKLALATATAEDVLTGKTFYAGDKELKTGTLTKGLIKVTGVISVAGGDTETITLPGKVQDVLATTSLFSQSTTYYSFFDLEGNYNTTGSSGITLTVSGNQVSFYTSSYNGDKTVRYIIFHE